MTVGTKAILCLCGSSPSADRIAVPIVTSSHARSTLMNASPLSLAPSAAVPAAFAAFHVPHDCQTIAPNVPNISQAVIPSGHAMSMFHH